MKYIRNLNFEDRPDQNFLKRIFQNFIVGRNFKTVNYFSQINENHDDDKNVIRDSNACESDDSNK